MAKWKRGTWIGSVEECFRFLNEGPLQRLHETGVAVNGTMSSDMSPAIGVSDLRERSFQNVVETVLQPSGIKVGGFPEEMFLNLGEDDKERFICNICYLIMNDCRQCDNSHSFCQSCIVAWSLTYGENARKCPFCRCSQDEYHPNKTIDNLIGDKRVQCLEEGCSFKAPLKIFLMHSHGKAKYSNAEVDFEKLKPPPAHLFVLPSFALSSRSGRMTGIREQLLQGRMMIQQMMLLMHLEMQLRHQALVSYQETNEPAVRMQRLDDVMALNEQLNEVGSILSMLLSSPINRSNDSETPQSQHAPPALAMAEVTDRMHRSSSDVFSALSNPTNASSTNSMLPHNPVRASFSRDRPTLMNHRLINATPPRFLPEVSQREENQDVTTTSLPFSLDSLSDVEDDSDDYEDRYNDREYVWEESPTTSGLGNSRGLFDFGVARPRSRMSQEFPPARALTTTTIPGITRSEQRSMYDQIGNWDDAPTAVTSRSIQASVEQRQTPLLHRGQVSRLQLSGPEPAGGELASARGFQSGADVSPGSAVPARASLPRPIALPSIQQAPRLVSSAELDESEGVATEASEQISTVPSSLDLTSSDQMTLRSIETTNQQQATTSTGSTTMVALTHSVSASPTALPLRNANDSMPQVLRQEPTEVAVQAAVQSSSRSRLLRQSSHPIQSRRTNLRPSVLQRTGSQMSEASQEQVTSGSQISGHRSMSKSFQGRSANAPSRPPPIEASLTQSVALIQQPSLTPGNVRLLNRSSPANTFPLRHQTQAIEHQKAPIPHPPGTAAPGTRRQNNPAPVPGVGRGLLMRSRRRSEIRQELRKSLRQDDN